MRVLTHEELDLGSGKQAGIQLAARGDDFKAKGKVEKSKKKGQGRRLKLFKNKILVRKNWIVWPSKNGGGWGGLKTKV